MAAEHLINPFDLLDEDIKRINEILHIKESDDKFKIERNGETLGWIYRYYPRNLEEGSVRYQANPIASNSSRDDCRTYDSAVSFILNYHGIYLK